MRQIGYLTVVTALMLFFSATLHAEVLSHSALSRGTKINDRDIEKHIRRTLEKEDATLVEPNLRVVSFNQIVLIIGRVSSAETKKKAMIIANQTPLVRKVNDHLQVAGSIAGLSRLSDRTTRLRVRRAVKKLGIDADYRVEVEHGHVYLMGLVTPQQGDQMTEAARKAKGVTRVTAIFEYL